MGWFHHSCPILHSQLSYNNTTTLQQSANFPKPNNSCREYITAPVPPMAAPQRTHQISNTYRRIAPCNPENRARAPGPHRRARPPVLNSNPMARLSDIPRGAPELPGWRTPLAHGDGSPGHLGACTFSDADRSAHAAAVRRHYAPPASTPLLPPLRTWTYPSPIAANHPRSFS